LSISTFFVDVVPVVSVFLDFKACFVHEVKIAIDGANFFDCSFDIFSKKKN
jgi:hypothetical protein